MVVVHKGRCARSAATLGSVPRDDMVMACEQRAGELLEEFRADVAGVLEAAKAAFGEHAKPKRVKKVARPLLPLSPASPCS